MASVELKKTYWYSAGFHSNRVQFAGNQGKFYEGQRAQVVTVVCQSEILHIACTPMQDYQFIRNLQKDPRFGSLPELQDSKIDYLA